MPAPDSAPNVPTGVKGISLPTRPVTSDEEASQSPELPAWLAGLVDEDTEFGLSDSDRDDDESVAQEPVLAASALPDWLGGENDLSPAESAADAPSLPDWLTGGANEFADSQQDAAGVGGELPAWLGGSTEPDGVPEPMSPVSLEPYTTDDDGVVLQGTPTEEATDAKIVSESELPDWLRQTSPAVFIPSEFDAAEGGDEEPVSATPPETAADDALALPDWLQQIAAEEDGSEQLPDWLSALAAEKTSPQPAVDAEVFVSAVEGGGPAPLEAGQTTEPFSTEGVAGAPESGIERASHIFEGEIPFAEFGSGEAEHPDWLADLVPTEAPVPPLQPEAQVFIGDALAEEPEVTEPTPAPEIMEEVPDWLKALDLTPSEPTPVSERSPQPVSLPQADLPQWLQELAPPGILAAASGGPAAVVSDALTAAEIPEWIAALRPEAQAEGAPPPVRPVLLTPPEPEGPLEGLAGTLPSTDLVDRPADGRSAVLVNVPDSVITQAQLWQRLLEQPRSAERSISHERPAMRRGSGLFRWFTTVFLFAGLFAAFWLIPEEVQLAQVSPTRIAPGVPALIEAVERLETGDTVVLAIEVSPAYAAEMQQVAAPILAHLNSRGVAALIVSSLPEGVGLGYGLPSLPETRSVVGDGYLAGGASGIAAFLAGSEAVDADHVLVLGSEPQRVTWWLEQNALRGAGARPISVGLSASAGPLLAPYLESGRVGGWVTGLSQALAYREMRDDETRGGDADLREYGRVADLLMIAHWAVAVLLLVAFFYNLFGKRGAS